MAENVLFASGVNPTITRQTGPLEARVLVGWMEREEAIRFLREDCWFDRALTESQAEVLWVPYRRAVDGLGVREVQTPARVPLNDFEKRSAAEFIRFFRSIGSKEILDVIKIDPMPLIVHQLHVATDQSETYRRSIASSSAWIKHCLAPTLPASRNVNIRAAPNHHVVTVPHREFALTFHDQCGFRVVENPNHVAACAFDGGKRMLLWAGYHRTFARMENGADSPDQSLLMALTSDADLMASDHSFNPALRDMIRGLHPPLFRDFFDPRFFMTTHLRRKRFELHIQAQIVSVDDPGPEVDVARGNGRAL